MRVSFIGLGAMGYPMAGHLAKKYNVSVYNRTHAKAQQWQTEYGGYTCQNLAEALQNINVIFMCLGRDEDVLSVVENPEFLDNISADMILVDHSTTSFNLAQKLHKICNERGAYFVDAPVSGGQDGAIKAMLSTMMGGDTVIIQKIEPLLSCYCQKQTHIGATGYGQLAKMVNQICVTSVLQGLSEGLKFAENENIDIDLLLNAISGGAAQSWQMVHRGETMHKRLFDFGFAIDWMIKDLGYALNRAQENGTDLDFTEQIYNEYQKLSQQGHGRKDTSALILAIDDE
ncbi:MAG: NAD(P)-dependent oxidoreductase [Alphaproteobacteria bacterium]